MDTYALAAMLGLFAFTVVLPGPNTFLVLQARLGEGPRRADSVIAGICVGDVLWGLLALFGMTLVLTHAPRVVPPLQLAGASWFFVAGFRSLASLGRTVGRGAETRGATVRRGTGGFLGGLAAAALNPSTAIMFTAVMPSFFGHGVPSAVQCACIAVLYGGVGALWYSSLAAGAARGRTFVAGPNAAAVAMGAVLARVPGLALMSFAFLFVAAV